MASINKSLEEIIDVLNRLMEFLPRVKFVYSLQFLLLVGNG